MQTGITNLIFKDDRMYITCSVYIYSEVNAHECTKMIEIVFSIQMRCFWDTEIDFLKRI